MLKVVVEEQSDGFVAYPLGLQGVEVAEEDTYDRALANVHSPSVFASGPLGFARTSERRRGGFAATLSFGLGDSVGGKTWQQKSRRRQSEQRGGKSPPEGCVEGCRSAVSTYRSVVEHLTREDYCAHTSTEGSTGLCEDARCAAGVRNGFAPNPLVGSGHESDGYCRCPPLRCVARDGAGCRSQAAGPSCRSSN